MHNQAIKEQETTKGAHNKRQSTNAGQQRYTSHKRQTPNQAAVKASNQQTTLTAHRNLCHRGARHRHKGTAPTASATGTHAAQIQLKQRRRGQPLAPVMIPDTAAPARWAVTNITDGIWDGPDCEPNHTLRHVHIHLNRPGRPRRGGPLGRRTRGRGVGTEASTHIAPFCVAISESQATNVSPTAWYQKTARWNAAAHEVCQSLRTRSRIDLNWALRMELWACNN